MKPQQQNNQTIRIYEGGFSFTPICDERRYAKEYNIFYKGQKYTINSMIFWGAFFATANAYNNNNEFTKKTEQVSCEKLSLSSEGKDLAERLKENNDFETFHKAVSKLRDFE